MRLKRLADLVRSLWGDRPAKHNAYDLKDADLVRLTRLVKEDTWGSYLALMDGVSAYKGEALLYEHDQAKNAFLRGYIAALRETPLLVERLAKQVKDAREREHNVAPAGESDRRSASLYATPGWRQRED